MARTASRFLLLLLPLFLSLGLGDKACAQDKLAHSGAGESLISFMGHDYTLNHVVIKYDIPFDGMIEIRLFDKDGTKIWQGQYTNTFGENEIRLKRSKFVPGEPYSYRLNYKEDQFSGNLVIPPLGLVE